MTDLDTHLVERLTEFLADYYREDLAQIPQSDHNHITLSYADIYQFDPDVADDVINHPTEILDHFRAAVPEVDLPHPDTLTDVEVRVADLPEQHTYAPGELRKDHGGKYLAINGMLDRVTNPSDAAEVLTYQCQRCSSETKIPQDVTTGERQEPYQCGGCERQGPFKILFDSSEFADYAKLRVANRPDTDDDTEGNVTGYALDDLIDEGGDTGILGRAGEPVTITGIVKRVEKGGGNELLFDHLLDIRSIEFDRDEETVDVAAHKDEFETLASGADAVDKFARSIAPNLHETDAWTAAMEFAVAYLFGAPRIDIPQGPTYRGDLHFLIVSDYGMGKSTFKEDVAAYSPKCISKSTTALSSGVGLTAAAVKDDFGEGQWTIKPGLLVRANGGHLILDEIDKGPDELTDMNDALEGEQTVDIEKAGKSATYQSRTAVLAMGNPIEGRFNKHEPVAAQLGIADSLLSRFDGIVTMRDESDEEMDAKIADTFGQSYIEAQQAEYGDRDEFDALERTVPIDVGQAWVQYAREEITPIMTDEQFDDLKDWYAEEVRQLNETFAEDGDGSDMPVPATVRELAAATKMAVAFARCELCETVQQRHVDRAKRLGKELVSQNWNGENFDATQTIGGAQSQKDRRQGIVRTLNREGLLDFGELQDETDIDESTLESDLRSLKRKGLVIEPEQNVYRAS